MLAHLKIVLHQFSTKMDLRHLVIDSLSVNLSGGDNNFFSFLIGTSFQILNEAMKIKVAPILQRPPPPSPPIFNKILWIKNDPAPLENVHKKSSILAMEVVPNTFQPYSGGKAVYLNSAH